MRTGAFYAGALVLSWVLCLLYFLGIYLVNCGVRKCSRK